MDDKILLSSYVVKLKDVNKGYETLNHIDGNVDFLNLFKDFTEEIYQNINRSSDIQGKHTVHLTLEEPAKIEANDRKLYGFFSSGVSGERFKVVDTITNEEEYSVEPHHASFRNVFFYLYVPRLKDTAYLILQRKSQFGIKLRLHSVLNQFLHNKGLHRFQLEINNVLHTKVYRKMMTEGNLKKVELIKKRIPKSIEAYINNNEELEEIKGTFKHSFTSRTSLPNEWKDYIDKIFKQQGSQDGTVEIQGLDNDYDDLEFELELNGKKKTFYIVNQQRIQPDIDVTLNIEFQNGEPTIDSLKSQAKEIITDITQIFPQNAK